MAPPPEIECQNSIERVSTEISLLAREVQLHTHPASSLLHQHESLETTVYSATAAPALSSRKCSSAENAVYLEEVEISVKSPVAK